MSRRNRKTLPVEAFRAAIDSLAHDGRGVTHVNGKATFIEGALPGEEVMFTYVMQRRRNDEGLVTVVFLFSSVRVAPHCGYRRRARLGAKFVEKKQAMLVGFREKRSAYLADLAQCEVLHPKVGKNLLALRTLLRGLDAYNRIPQVEVAASDKAVALVFRHLDPLSEHDAAALRTFGEQQGFYIYLQPAGPDSAVPLWPDDARLSYRLDEFDVELDFRPTDFTQVNGDINGAMVHRALELLELNEHERVLDLFCGLGNFTLPIARRAAHVVGVEGDAKLVAWARDNARANGITNAEFHAADLSDEGAMWPWAAPRAMGKVKLPRPQKRSSTRSCSCSSNNSSARCTIAPLMSPLTWVKSVGRKSNSTSNSSWR